MKQPNQQERSDQSTETEDHVSPPKGTLIMGLFTISFKVRHGR
jgi:hypothetical protein